MNTPPMTWPRRNAPRARERVTDAGRERLCNACGDWWPLDLFCRNPRCQRGYTCECKACRVERRQRARAA